MLIIAAEDPRAIRSIGSHRTSGLPSLWPGETHPVHGGPPANTSPLPRGPAGKPPRKGLQQAGGREGGGRGYPLPGLRIMGATLHPAISPKQKTNRSLMLAGRLASGMGTNPSLP